MLAEWEDKCNDLEDQLHDHKKRLEYAETNHQAADKQLKAATKETGKCLQQIKAKEDEIKSIQRKYEEELQNRESAKVELQAKHK